jgi:putative peptidoglycan lipid II flippase
MDKKIAPKTIAVGFATLISRIFGFIRDVVIAIFFGTTSSAQAFVVAFKIPNMLRDFVGEGATNAAVIPVLSKYKKEKGDRDFWSLSYSILRVFSFFLFFLMIGLILFAPILVRIIVPGFLTSPEKFRLTVRMTRLLSPFIFFIGIGAILAGILNSHKVFWPSAWAPVILNISIITASIFLTKKFGVYSLVIGIFCGGILQLILHFLILFRIKKPKDFFTKVFLHPKLKQILRLLYPRFLGGIVYHLNILVDTILSSLEFIVGSGAVAALYYAQRLIQLPLAVFAVSMATVSLPYMAESASMNNGDVEKTLSFSLKYIAVITIPAMVGLFVLAMPIIEVLFEHGKFSFYSTSITSQALRFYSLGLFFYGGIKLLVATFYSMEDTFTPVKTSAYCLLINLFLSIFLMPFLKIAGLCLATSIAAGFNFFLLFSLLKKKLPKIKVDEIKKDILKLFIPASVMGVIIFLMKFFLWNRYSSNFFLLIIFIIIGISSYIGLGLVLKCEQIERAWKYLLRR